MTTPESLQTLSDEQLIENVAIGVMGWEKRFPGEAYRGARFRKDEWIWWDDDGVIRASVEHWNPLTDWNHWRQVEEKVMKDDGFAYKFKKYFWDDAFDPFADYMKADLRTRCLALIAALDALPSPDGK